VYCSLLVLGGVLLSVDDILQPPVHGHRQILQVQVNASEIEIWLNYIFIEKILALKRALSLHLHCSFLLIWLFSLLGHGLRQVLQVQVKDSEIEIWLNYIFIEKILTLKRALSLHLHCSFLLIWLFTLLGMESPGSSYTFRQLASIFIFLQESLPNQRFLS
jgi:hypothetical protein